FARSSLRGGLRRCFGPGAALEPERSGAVYHRNGCVKIAECAGHVGGAARAAGQRVALGIVVLRYRLAQPAFDLTASGVPGLPDPDRFEVGEARVGVAATFDDGELALVPERLEARHVLIHAEA